MPDSFSIELRSLLTGLLQRDVNKRLGCRGRGAEELKSHPFFRGIDWRTVLLQRLTPPLIPARGEVNAADAFDIGSFDDEDTKHIRLTDADQELYRNFPVVVSERWQQEIAETIFDHINHEADKAEMKRKNKNKLGYQEEEQSDCILHGYIKRLGGTFTATWLTRYVRLYPNRLELWSDSGKQPELIFMDQIEEVCNDYVQIKNEQCIVIKLYNHSKYVFTNSDEIGLREWHNSLKAAHKESLDMMTRMADKATKIYGTEIPLKHMGKRRQQLQQEASAHHQMNTMNTSSQQMSSSPSSSSMSPRQSVAVACLRSSENAQISSKIANLEQKTIQRELEDSSKRTRGICRKANSLNQAPQGFGGQSSSGSTRQPFPSKQASERIHGTSGTTMHRSSGSNNPANPLSNLHSSGAGGGHTHSHSARLHAHHHSRRAHHHRHHHHRATFTIGSSSSGIATAADETPAGSASSTKQQATSGQQAQQQHHHHHHHHHHHRHSASTRSTRSRIKHPKASSTSQSMIRKQPAEVAIDTSGQAPANLEQQSNVELKGELVDEQKQQPEQTGIGRESKTDNQVAIPADQQQLITNQPSVAEDKQAGVKKIVVDQQMKEGEDRKTSSEQSDVERVDDSTAENRKLSGSSVQSEEGGASDSSSYDGSSSSVGSANSIGSCASDNTLADGQQQQQHTDSDKGTGGPKSDPGNNRELLLLANSSGQQSASTGSVEIPIKTAGLQPFELEDDDEDQVGDLDEPVCLKLAVSLENVNESQEVLRDPSKRITSDNKQREQDLVAQYEKLNINSLNSSSSIEE